MVKDDPTTQKTTTGQKWSSQRKSDLARIHILRKELGFDESLYREMLGNLTGKTSSGDLDDAGRARVIAFMEGKRNVNPEKVRWFKTMDDPERGKMFKKLWAMLQDGGKPAEYADAIAKRMFKVERVEWLNYDQLHKLITALVYHQKRKEKS